MVILNAAFCRYQGTILFFLRAVIFGVILGSIVITGMYINDTSRLSFNLTGSSRVPDRVSYYDAIAKAGPAVVNIYSTHNEIYRSGYRTQTLERTSVGSGVIMNDNGYLLTCYHVIKDAEQIILGLQDGRFVEAQLVGFDPHTDLAVLHSNTSDLQVIPQILRPTPRLGDVVLAIGNPYNLGQTTTRGIISATGRAGWGSYIENQNYANFIQTDVVLNAGNSGGALIDSNGLLLGINNANFKMLDNQKQIQDVNGVSFAVPYALAKKVMDSIIEHGRVVRGYLGVGVQSAFNNNELVITSITPNGPAQLAGLQLNDVIISINGETLNSEQILVQWIAESKPGTSFTMDIRRGSQIIRLPVVIGELRS